MSTQVRALAMLLAYSFSSSSGATENFWPPATPSPSPKPKIIAKPRVEKTPWFEEDTKDSEATLLNAIQGFDVILKNTAGPQAQSVRLNRVQLILRLARYRILKKSDEKSKGGLDLVQTALADCQQILNAPGTSPSTRGRTLYLKGLAQTYLNHPDDAVATFKEALSILPKYGMAGWAAFFVIDETFEEGKFADAIAFHDLYESLWNPTLRRLARYKKAWAHLNIGQPAKAAGLMIELIRENGNDPIGVDCLKDLASQHASSLTEAQILANAGEIFKEPSKRSTYLRAVQANLAATDRLGRGSPVLAVVLNDERDPAQRVLVFMGAFSQARKEFASREHFHTFEDLLVKMTAWKVTPQSPGFDKIAGLLDWELRLLSKAYLETYSGRVESPEVLGKEELATSLEKVFSTYYAFFPASRVVAPLVSAWLDVCIEQKHWNCVAQVGKLTLEAPNLKALSPRGETERIAALDALYNASPTTPTLREELLRACADFSEHNPASPHWLKITKRWVTLKIEAGQTQKKGKNKE